LNINFKLTGNKIPKSDSKLIPASICLNLLVEKSTFSIKLSLPPHAMYAWIITYYVTYGREYIGSPYYYDAINKNAINSAHLNCWSTGATA